jgi:hypothetical protein
MQVLTWREGATWYQIVVGRPRELGGPYTVEDLIRVAAGLR